MNKYMIFIFLTMMISCVNNDFNNENSENQNAFSSEKGYDKSTLNTGLTYSNNSLIIQYDPETTEVVKNELRTIHNVVSHSSCRPCVGSFFGENIAYLDVELWEFGTIINIEPKKQVIEDEDDEIGVEGINNVDYNFTFVIDDISNYIGTNLDLGYTNRIKLNNNGITVAILDTGLDTNYQEFPHRFLYNSSDPAGVGMESGWDFVNDDHNAFDDNQGKHGTIVTKIALGNNATNDVQFMPIKVANVNGEISYAHLLFGVQLAIENNADIIHTSLGFLDDGFGDFENSILANIMTNNSNTLFIASAGNTTNNNDIIAHYPSSFNGTNIIAVAAGNQYTYSIQLITDLNNDTQIADFSNYGATSVDFFARGEHIPFDNAFVDGTSFAAPVVTSKVINLMNVFNNGISVSNMTQYLNYNEGVFVNFNSQTLFNKLILPY